MTEREDDEVAAELRMAQRRLKQLVATNHARCSVRSVILFCFSVFLSLSVCIFLCSYFHCLLQSLLKNLGPLIEPNEKLRQVKQAHAMLEDAYRRRQRSLRAQKRKPNPASIEEVRRALQQHAARIQAIQAGLQTNPQQRGQAGTHQHQQQQQQLQQQRGAVGAAPTTPTSAGRGAAAAGAPGSGTRLVITSAGLASPATHGGATTISHSFTSLQGSRPGMVAGAGGAGVNTQALLAQQQAAAAAAAQQNSPGFQRLSGRVVSIRPGAGSAAQPAIVPQAYPAPVAPQAYPRPPLGGSGLQAAMTSVPQPQPVPVLSGMTPSALLAGTASVPPPQQQPQPTAVNPAQLLAARTAAVAAAAAAAAQAAAAAAAAQHQASGGSGGAGGAAGGTSISPAALLGGGGGGGGGGVTGGYSSSATAGLAAQLGPPVHIPPQQQPMLPMQMLKPQPQPQPQPVPHAAVGGGLQQQRSSHCLPTAPAAIAALGATAVPTASATPAAAAAPCVCCSCVCRWIGSAHS